MGSSSDNLINKANIRRLSIKRSRVSKKKAKLFKIKIKIHLLEKNKEKNQLLE